MPSPKQARNEPNKTISFTVLTCIVIYSLCIPIETTSNIRPTWRSGTPSHKDDDPHQDDKRLPRNADYETTSLASNVSAGTDHLRASSSSLLPAIVDLPNRQQAQRRSSQPVQFKLAHLSPTSSNAANITDEASSLDHWWSQQGLGNSSLLPLLNEQVHFDEEHHTGGANNNTNLPGNMNYNREEEPSSSAAKRSRRIAGNQHRRQDAADDQPAMSNDDVNLSNLSPKHAEDNQQHLFDQVQQRPPRNNSMEPVYQDNKAGNNRSSFSGGHDQDNLFDSTPDLVHSNAAALELNKTSNARRTYSLDAQNNNSLEFHPPSHHYEPQSIYYLPNGDKWNSASFHNSNEQQDLQTTTKAYEPLVATTTPARRRPINRAAHNPMNSMQNDDRLHQHQPDRLSYGFVPSKANSQEQPLVDWPRTAPNLVQRHQMPVRLGQHQIQQVPRRHPQPLLGASSPPRRQQLIRVGEIPASQLLLNNINDRQLLNAARQHNQQQRLMLASARPRKSLLGTLGEKLNTWTSSNGAEHSQLENYFYEPSSGAYTRDNNRYRHQATIAKRPIRLASTANKWPLQQHQQPPNYFYSRPQRALQSVQHNPAAMFYNNNRVMQPTVAPAASTLNQLYGHRGPHLMSRQQQQPANFIPVVAVQMTQTSPAPNGGNVRPLSPDEANQVQAGAPEMTSSEIDEYLEAKTGQVMGKQQQTSASNRDHSTSQIHDMYRAPGQPAGDHHHTTTVKSAVFGYLPHQAEAPLMQAINMLPQLPTMLSGQQQENYANQMDRSQQSMEATVPFVDQQHQQQSSYPLLDDTQPSLALQLQANSLLHNDIAHPFASPTGSSAAAVRQPQVGLAYPAATLEQMQQLAGLQLNGANQLPSVANGYLMLDSQHAADSAGLFGATNNNNNNQFYSVAGTSPAMLAGLIPSGSSSVPQLFDPFGSQQGNWASSPDFVAGTQNDSPTNGDQTNGESTGGDSASGQSHDTTLTASANVKNSLKGNRKRSSEFFASAGQLLLSALPLLLAPTLGLMLASSGSSPVARYHGANGIQTAGGPAPGYPSNYMGSLSGGGGGGDGLVSNSSPHMFTPTPLNYNLGPEYTSTSAPPAPPGSFLKNRSNAAPSTTHSPTSSKRNGQPAPLSALTGLRMTPPTKPTTTTTSTTHRPKHAVVLTTLSPPPFSNATNLIASDLATLLSNQTSTHLYIDDDNNNNEEPANQTITAPSTTIFMLSDPNGNQTKLSEQQPDNGGQYYVLATTTKEPVVMEPNGTTLLKSLLDQNNHHYEIGYEGADFDAQFATLVKPSESRTKPPVITYVTTTTTTTTTPKPMRYSLSNNKRYQYSEVSPMNSSLVSEVMPSRRRPVQRLPSPNLVAIHKNSSRFDANEPLETAPPPETPVTELYPVSTWPRSRRKTVSLVTSNGNKTLVDAGDRYHLGSSTSNRAVDGASRDRNRTSSSTNDHSNQVFEVSVTTSNNHQPGGAQRLRTVSTLADSFLLDRMEAPSSLERHKRDLGSATDAIKRKLPRRVKVVKKRVKLKKRRNVTFNLSQVGAAAAANNQTFGSTGQEHNATTQMTNGHSARRNDHQVEGDLMESQPSLARVQNNNNNNLTNANNDTMRGDSSRSKSAIVTAMITQVADSGTDEANSLESEGNYHGVGEDDDGPEDDPRHLRDQLLRKKILLDRLATRSGSTGRRLALASGSDDYMALGGRAGRIPVPTGSDRVEDVDSATELEEREQQQERRRGQSSRRLSSSALELAEDTKKALAKFGTLLLEDTLQIPGEPSRRRKSSSKLQYRSQSEAPKYQQNYEHSELASATERYSSRLATPAPFEEIETFDNNNSSHLLRPTRVVRDRSHQHHQNYQRARDNGTENDDLYPISQPLGGRYNYSTVGLPARHNEHEYRNNRNTYTTGTNGTSWSSSAGHDMQARYNRTSDQHAAAPPPPHNDPLDARHSSYTNYTTLAPHYTGPNYHHPSSGYHMDSHAPPPGYTGPPGARREPLPHSHPHSHPSEHHHHQSYPPVAHDYHNHSGHYAPAAYDYSSSSAPPNQRHQPADYHGHSSYDHYSPQAAPPAPPPPPPQQRYHWPPASSPPAEQPTRPPAYNQNEWSTPYQHPAGYSFSPSAPPTAYSFNQQQVAPTPPLPQPPVQGGRTSVNEYLKRVQFSDSDRDKLMAR